VVIVHSNEEVFRECPFSGRYINVIKKVPTPKDPKCCFGTEIKSASEGLGRNNISEPEEKVFQKGSFQEEPYMR